MKSKNAIFDRVSATLTVASVIALSAAVLASPESAARGFGGAFGNGYAGGFGNAYPWGFGSTGGGYYIEDSAERAYDSSHYWDGSLRGSDLNADSQAQSISSTDNAQTAAQPVSEAERLQAADQTYSWGFDKARTSTGGKKPQ